MSSSNFKDLSKAEQRYIDDIKEEHILQAMVDIDENMKFLGFEEVESEGINLQERSNNPSDLILTDKLYFNKEKKQYNFVGYWDFKAWDSLTSTSDIASVRMNNNTYPIVRSYAYSYNQAGKSTGSDNDGSHSTNSHATKKFENKAGVVYNVKDQWVKQPSTGIYKTDSGRVSMWFKKGKDSNKVFFDFHHNYKTSSVSANATLGGVKLSESSLTVSYSKTSKNYQRASRGKSI